jgi:hypothetical protein
MGNLAPIVTRFTYETIVDGSAGVTDSSTMLASVVPAVSFRHHDTFYCVILGFLSSTLCALPSNGGPFRKMKPLLPAQYS